ncbi:hypothetical protein [Staphylococcus shinii]|uniref:hypothetical protein n=1 Tax=Staphylococcus shinii TaxID=2912228 RepID=UPI003D802551
MSVLQKLKERLKRKFRENKKIKPQLTIRVYDDDDVPEIIFNGNKIDYINEVDFNWKTSKGDVMSGGYKFNIAYIKESDLNNGGIFFTKEGFVSPGRI